MRAYCNAAYMTEYKRERYKKEALQKLLKPLKKYQYMYAKNLFGEKNLEEEYKLLYKDVRDVGFGKLPHEKRTFLREIDKCVEAGDSFYVSRSFTSSNHCAVLLFEGELLHD